MKYITCSCIFFTLLLGVKFCVVLLSWPGQEAKSKRFRQREFRCEGRRWSGPWQGRASRYFLRLSGSVRLLEASAHHWRVLLDVFSTETTHYRILHGGQQNTCKIVFRESLGFSSKIIVTTNISFFQFQFRIDNPRKKCSTWRELSKDSTDHSVNYCYCSFMHKQSSGEAWRLLVHETAVAIIYWVVCWILFFSFNVGLNAHKFCLTQNSKNTVVF